MGFYRFIKIKGEEGKNTGYFVPRLYRLDFNWRELRNFGLSLVKERLNGWTIWWVDNHEEYVQAIERLDELKKTRIFDYKVSRPLNEL